MPRVVRHDDVEFRGIWIRQTLCHVSSVNIVVSEPVKLVVIGFKAPKDHIRIAGEFLTLIAPDAESDLLQLTHVLTVGVSEPPRVVRIKQLQLMISIAEENRVLLSDPL